MTWSCGAWGKRRILKEGIITTERQKQATEGNRGKKSWSRHRVDAKPSRRPRSGKLRSSHVAAWSCVCILFVRPEPYELSCTFLYRKRTVAYQHAMTAARTEKAAARTAAMGAATTTHAPSRVSGAGNRCQLQV